VTADLAWQKLNAGRAFLRNPRRRLKIQMSLGKSDSTALSQEVGETEVLYQAECGFGFSKKCDHEKSGYRIHLGK
jgi:hypothetical protein